METSVKDKNPEIDYEKYVIRRSVEDYWRAEEKVELILTAMAARIPVTTLCKLNNVSPSQFYEWREKFLASRVHTTLGFNPTPFVFMAEFGSAFFGSLWPIDSLSGMRLSHYFRANLRDFSKTGRTGEFAQALSYLFATSQAGYLWCGDTYGALDYIFPGKVEFLLSQKTSDYLYVRKYPTSQFLALESKGVTGKRSYTNSRIRSSLKDGLEQCDAFRRSAFRRLGLHIHKVISITTVFRFEDDPDDSFMVFVDPVHPGEVNPDHVEKMRCYHLSRWFIACGRFELAKKVLNGELNVGQFEKEPRFGNRHVVLGTFRMSVPVEGDSRSFELRFLVDPVAVTSRHPENVGAQVVEDERPGEIVQKFFDGTGLAFNFIDEPKL